MKNEWSGAVTLENIEEVAKKIVDLLSDKYFTDISIRKVYNNQNPDVFSIQAVVHSSLRLKKNIKGNFFDVVFFDGEDKESKVAHAHFYLPHGETWTLITNEPNPKMHRSIPFVKITSNQVYIEQRIPSGFVTHQIFSIENHNEGD